MSGTQIPLRLPVKMPRSVYAYGLRTSGEVHGVVLTKPHVVDLILDLAGYTTDKNLAGMRLLEPSCGHGAFLFPAVRRLWQAARDAGIDAARLVDCIAAFDIDETHVAETRRGIRSTLRDLGVKPTVARKLADAWVRLDDFLLASVDGGFDVVVGNPPYVRIEQLSGALSAEYRSR